MDSDSALRIWQVSREAGRPLPQFSEDDVIDFMVTEAVLQRARAASKDAETKQKQRAWKEDIKPHSMRD